MGFMESVKTCFAKFVDFSGRAVRSEFWWFFLFYVLVSIVAGILGHFVGAIAAVVMFLPMLSVQVRRLHDVGRTGWWLLIGLVPLLGILLLLYWAVQPSDGANQYG